MLVTYGVTTLFSVFATILAVGGGGESTGMYLIAGLLLTSGLACFVYSIRLAQARKPVRAILLGLVPLPLTVAIVAGVASIVR